MDFGEATLSSGTVTINCSNVKSTSKILVSRKTNGGTLGFLSVGTIIDATSFIVNSLNILDSSIVHWMVVNP